MKKQTSSRFYTLVSATLVFNLVTLQSYSQELTASLRTPVSIHSSDISHTISTTPANEKVINSFKRSFSGVQNPSWEISNNNYHAHFQVEDRQALASFRNNGKLNYTILYGREQHLPSYVKSVVRANFTDEVITATQYIIRNDVGTWLVTLESKTEIFKVKVNGDDVYVMERIRKVKAPGA